MSSFGTCLITDEVIADITPELNYAVQIGAASKTGQSVQANSATNTSVVFQVQLPSEQIVLDRHVTISTEIQFTIKIGVPGTGAQIPATEFAFDLGLSDSLQSFPFNKLITTAQASINNTSISCNEQDVVDSLLRFNNSRELYRYNSTTPSMPDQSYQQYSEGVGATNNMLASFNTASYDIDQIPRGSFPVTFSTTNGFGNSGISHYVGGVLTDGSLESEGVTDYWILYLTTTVTEPLLTLSPFIWSDPDNNGQGICGINNMSFNFSIDPTCKRFWSTAYDAVPFSPTGPNTAYQVSLGWNGASGFVNTVMNLEFLSTQPTQKIASKNVVPYYDFSRYISNVNSTSAIAAGVSTTLVTNTIQINSIPDLFVVFLRVPMAYQNAQCSASFLKINSVSVTFNNAAGLLSSFTAPMLWNMSRKNGLNMSYAEWSGAQLVNGNNNQGELVSTTGSILAINPAYDLSLAGSYLSCGSLGNFQVSFQINYTNNTPYTLAPEAVVLCCNSGIFVTEQGTSSSFLGILQKSVVLQTAEGQNVPSVSRASDERVIGGKSMNRGLARHPLHMQHMKKMSGGAMPYTSNPPTSGGSMMPMSGGSRASKLSKLVR